ncbi:MAG: OprO/OprP family phosphate-selective porin [Pseudomonadota bacterium]|nr:OprO/OprP family phosphate-selective porin [Pseudomonadota bacterium]
MTPKRSPPSVRKTLAAVSLVLSCGLAGAQTATETELARKLDALAAELASVKTQLQQLQQKQAEGPTRALAQVEPPSGAVTPPPSLPPPTPASVPDSSGSLFGPGTVLTSYGELAYNRPLHQGREAEADVRRFVLGYQHRFDEKTKVVTELEVEHAVSSAGDPGEVEVEQAYVERLLNPVWSLRAGLFLMPAGLLNENHEPTAYYGVERNFVETAIIPSTWREGGLQAIGNFDNGLTAQAGITTSFNLNKWDAAATEGRASPLGSIHQELALAKAHDLALFGALNWRGIPGLLVGASVFTGQATQAQTADTSRVTLWDLHARWTPGPWDISALYTRGSISNTAALNRALVGNPTLIPASFDGYYVQSAYKVWSSGDYALSPFVRWEQFNTARSYADLGAGLTPDASPGERVVTLGANFRLSQDVVLKADYQHFRVNPDLNRVDLGLGWSF